MKNKLLFFVLFIFIFSCQTEEEKAIEKKLHEKLPATLVENPRSASNTNSAQLTDLGHLTFADTLHDFGSMKEGEKVEYEFAFTNTGNRDIIISDAKGSCGCTVPEYSSAPIKKNETGKMKVTFNSQGKHGFNEKTVHITTNGNPSEYDIKIHAVVN